MHVKQGEQLKIKTGGNVFQAFNIKQYAKAYSGEMKSSSTNAAWKMEFPHVKNEMRCVSITFHRN